MNLETAKSRLAEIDDAHRIVAEHKAAQRAAAQARAEAQRQADLDRLQQEAEAAQESLADEYRELDAAIENVREIAARVAASRGKIAAFNSERGRGRPAVVDTARRQLFGVAPREAPARGDRLQQSAAAMTEALTRVRVRVL